MRPEAIQGGKPQIHALLDLCSHHVNDIFVQILVEFVVIPRPGEAPVHAPAPFRVRALRGFPVGISSSQIRERIRAGADVAAP